MRRTLTASILIAGLASSLAAAPVRREVRVLDFAFDPIVDGEPRLRNELTGALGGRQLHLVQFNEAVSEDVLTSLRENGLRPLQYYPHDTYLVWGAAVDAESAAGLGFVRWRGLFQPGYKISSDLAGRSGRVANVDVMFYNDGAVEATLATLRDLGASVKVTYPSQPDRAFFNAIVELDAEAFVSVAQLDEVLWLGYQSPQPVLDDEMSDQIVAGNHPGGVPVTGYLSHLATLDVDGSGVIWSITDSGVDYDHPDLNGHIVGGFNYPGCITANPGDATSSGHGTHVAGIAMGDATGGFTDADGFFYGLGMALEASIFAQNPICPGAVSWPPAGGWQELSKQGVLGGAVGANNSWTSGEGTQHGYQATERTHDFMVRDGNFDSAAVEPYTIVFSAGNSGNSGLTSPKEAKNVIVTASSRNFRSGDIDSIAVSSSRGPAVDGRQVPTVAAPGQQITSARADGGGSCTSTPVPGTDDLYSFCSGTSMAAPHVSGSVILMTEWWRNMTTVDPSPALAKSLLVNSSVDMGAEDRWNINEGWGRANITQALAPAVGASYVDQEIVLTNNGQSAIFVFDVEDAGQPLMVTLGWSDAPGAVGANPALVNNLDLSVTTDATQYLGNVMSSGWSVPGGSADLLNNLENVFVQAPGSTVVVTVAATAINGDGVPADGDLTDQDFVLVCTNCVGDGIFADGFESGTTDAWDVVVPGGGGGFTE